MLSAFECCDVVMSDVMSDDCYCWIGSASRCGSKGRTCIALGE